MKRGLLMLTGLTLGALTVIGCGGASEELDLIFRDLTPQEQVLTSSANDFSFDLFQEAVAASDGGNVFVSPLSVSFALGMTYNGAGGGTKAEMAEVLGFDTLTLDEVNEAYRGLIEQLTHLDANVRLEIANSIWYRNEFAVDTGFLARNQEYFSARVEGLDFAAPDAADTIDGWVGEATHGKITKIAPNPIPANAVMYLINAIYFKGDWTVRFDRNDTRPEPFHLPDGSDREVPLMRLQEDLDYLQTANFKAVDMGFGEGHFRMAVVLPLPNVPLDVVVESLTSENWSTWQDSFFEVEVALRLPRFELEYEQSLVQNLADLGMPTAFTSSADFSGINPTHNLFISEVKHKTYLKVHEEGAEAAAVTSVEVSNTSMPQVIEMRVDRPFLIVIHDRHTGAVLFVGKIVDPPTG
jgi:serpin B